MIVWNQCLNGLEMGISHNPSVLFMCHLKTRLESLRIIILFLSKMAIHYSSQSWPKEISKALCSPSKMCTFFAWMLILYDNRMFPVFVTLVLALLSNRTVGQL